MKTLITIAELLHKIKVLKREVSDLYEKNLNPENEEYKKSKLLLTLYNPSRCTTIKGIDIDNYNKDIQSMYDTLNSKIKNLRILLMIKEHVNSVYYIEVNDILTGEKININISQVLVLKSPIVKNYYMGLLNKIKDDIDTVEDALYEHENTVLSHDNIDRYVIAKINSISGVGVDKDSFKQGYYQDFAKEYTNANALAIYDPLHLKDKYKELSENIINFYDTIDYKLLEFNSTHKIWIDLDAKDGKYWGMEEKVTVKMPFQTINETNKNSRIYTDYTISCVKTSAVGTSETYFDTSDDN